MSTSFSFAEYKTKIANQNINNTNLQNIRRQNINKIIFAECFFIEINLCKRKWLVCCSNNPYRDNIKDHLNTINSNLDLYSSKYEYIIVIGDFNVEVNDKFMSNFCEPYNLSSLIKESTCYKNPSSIDLILTNSPHSFQSSSVVETGLPDFHKMIMSL